MVPTFYIKVVGIKKNNFQLTSTQSKNSRTKTY